LHRDSAVRELSVVICKKILAMPLGRTGHAHVTATKPNHPPPKNSVCVPRSHWKGVTLNQRGPPTQTQIHKRARWPLPLPPAVL